MDEVRGYGYLPCSYLNCTGIKEHTLNFTFFFKQYTFMRTPNTNTPRNPLLRIHSLYPVGHCTVVFTLGRGGGGGGGRSSLDQCSTYNGNSMQANTS